MYALVGLGNPGKDYENTRHNVGFMFVDHFGELKDVMTQKPDTFMNKSGEAVKKFLNYYKIPVKNLYVVHDDLDLRLGEYKIQLGRGPKVHYGVNSIEEKLKTKDFWRIRIGVDNRDQDNRIPGEDYVLQNFSSEEKEILMKVIQSIVVECKKLLQ